eukprot:TCONS_00022831-protein
MFVILRRGTTSQLTHNLPKRHQQRFKGTTTLDNQNKSVNNEEEIWKENWKRRCELATAYRGLAKYNMHEGVCNHLSVKAPSLHKKGERQVMLTAPYGIYWTEVTPRHLVGVDLETGELVEGKEPPEITAQSIHMGIYAHARKKEINCIMHTHAMYTSILGTLQDPGIQMIHQTSTRFLNNVSYDQDFPLMANQTSNQEGERLGRVLGNKEVLMMGHHGLATVGKSVAMAFDLHYYFEKAAEIQVKALQTGQPLKLLSTEIAIDTHAQMVDCQEFTAHAHFDALQKTLEREYPSFLA